MKRRPLQIQLFILLLLTLLILNSVDAQNVTLNFMGMTPHVGQKLEARLIDKSNFKEVDRTTLDQIANAEFSIDLTGKIEGSDFVEFYADLNQNGIYDGPPLDHAWKIDADSLNSGMNMFNFSHNTSFSELNWRQNLSFEFTGMNPHVGQKLEISVRDINRIGKEVGRVTLDSITSPDFTVNLPFLEIGGNYLVDYYADRSQNSIYDAPPADHAWRDTILNVDGDEILSFAHNTNFTDINWKQLLQFNFMGMNPHVGQQLQIAVRDINHAGKEVGRITIPEIIVPNFSVELPFLEVGRNYIVDYYADRSKNGSYDAPPADHAWRDTLLDVSGNVNLTFSHNTNFTDINWKQLLVFDFIGMNPHVGQRLEVAVKDINRAGKEVGRISINEIRLPDFSVDLPFLEVGHNYIIDYYADRSKNGIYDSPPADHAWRDTIFGVAGDTSLSFSHNTNFTDIKWKQLLTFNFLGMNPHLGQKLEIAVRDINRTGKEVGRFTMPEIMVPNFAIELPFLEVGHNYIVDYYADRSKNGIYDVPPTDHAWRETVMNVDSNESLVFSHNTDFTDINWKQLLKFDLVGMNPHVGQKLEIAVRDLNQPGLEVGRFTLAEVMIPDFTVELPFLEIGHSYNVNYYADRSRNGVYDAPPVDHAWRETVMSVDSNESLVFSHNTDFTDINWKQLLTLDFSGMTPHVGQQLEVRVRDVNQTGREVGRFSMPSIVVPDFQVCLPHLDLGRTYFVDFYADLNQNGTYDAPGADHAWREMLSEAAGDTSLSFSHNTNFTDIGESNTLTIDFTGMNPHVGQLLELKVTDSETGEEVERVRGIIRVPDFKVNIPGIISGNSYNVDFYADLSGNGLYDAPPTDHAWRESFTAVDDDQSFSFSHNTDFIDVDWAYQMTLAATDMNPHIGQEFKLKVIDKNSGSEIGKFRMPSIMTSFFFVRVPGLRFGENYDADFFADFNQNGVYDAPPEDHSWRVNFDDDDGDEVVEFGHNTDFTDIMFTSGIEEFTELQGLEVFPNPFSNSFGISLELSESTDITISIFNNIGQLIRYERKDNVPSGMNILHVEGLGEIAKGIYFLKLDNGNGGFASVTLFNK